MPKVLDNVIVASVPGASLHSLKLSWAGGATTSHELRHLLNRGVFRALADPNVFSSVRVGERGRSLEWPGEIELCADALWFEAHPEDAPAQGREPVDHTAPG